MTDFDYDAFFDGASVDGSIAWLHTDEVLVGGDSDTANDVYERVGAAITLVSGGNADTGAFWAGSSENGSRVFFDTQEPLVGQDSDASTDIYERAAGSTTLISTGPDGGNGELFSAFQGTTRRRLPRVLPHCRLAARAGHRRHAGRLRARRRRHDPRLAGAGERERALPGDLQGRLARRDPRLLRHERAPGQHRDGHLPRHLRAPRRDDHVPLARPHGRERRLLRVLPRSVGRRHPAVLRDGRGARRIRHRQLAGRLLVLDHDRCVRPPEGRRPAARVPGARVRRVHGAEPRARAPALRTPRAIRPPSPRDSSRSAHRTRTSARRTRSAPPS